MDVQRVKFAIFNFIHKYIDVNSGGPETRFNLMTYKKSITVNGVQSQVPVYTELGLGKTKITLLNYTAKHKI